MTPLFRHRPLALAISLLATINYANAAKLEEVLIIGNKDAANKLPGSAFVIDEKEMAKFNYTDIGRVLAQVPGVYLRDEDGQGLRPNIGIRGSGSDRNKKVTVMEDGILAAPAAYADPAAYYFPTTGRISAVEVLKGPGVLRHGPYTVGGAVNLVSTPIPQETGGKLTAELAENNEYRLHANVGGMSETFGMLLEAHQQETDGFMNLDNSDRDSGFSKSDYLAKFRVQTPQDAKLPQCLDVKFLYADETSDIGYLGLADTDYEQSSNRRYGVSTLDEMDNHYTSSSASYTINPADDLALNVTSYYNVFKRDWFRVDKVNGVKIGDLFKPDSGVNFSGQNTTELALLQGADTVGNENITLKHNDRDYYSKGIQFSADWNVKTGSISHTVDGGIRIHQDEMDRYQPSESFSQVNGQLNYLSTSLPVDADDATQNADTVSMWLLDTISVTDTVDVTVSARREQIDAESVNAKTINNTLSQSVNETLLGIGATWQITSQWQLLAGVHDGFAPVALGPTSENDPETSTNYEVGARFAEGNFNAELISFFSDYDSAVQNCSDAAACTVNNVSVVTGSQALGESEIKGFEASTGYTLTSGSLQFPLQLNWTYTEAEITKASSTGSTLDGDIMPYIPENQLFASAGVVMDNGWDAYLSAKYVDETCIDYKCDRAGQDNRFRETETLLTYDFVTHYQINSALQTYFKVENLSDEQRITIRTPAGIRTNKPRTALVGVTYNF